MHVKNLQEVLYTQIVLTLLMLVIQYTTVNLRLKSEKYLQHQQNLYHVFIDFKKAFDGVWHAALWATMRKYSISANLVRTIEQLYDKATSAIQMNGSIG